MGKHNVYTLLRFALLPILCLARPGPAASAWIDLPTDTDAAEPTVKVVHSNDEGLVLSIEFAALQVEHVQTGAGAFAVLSMPGCGVTPEVGAPLLPVLRQYVQLPQSADVSLRIVDSTAEEASLDDLGIAGDLMPAQPPIPKEPGARETAVFVQDPGG